MKHIGQCSVILLAGISALALTSCSSTMQSTEGYASNMNRSSYVNVDGRLPSHIQTAQKTIVVDPREHVWGAYDSTGTLVKTGLASAGSDYCPDLKRPCHTATGVYHVETLGDADCKSNRFPLPHGGAPMPYCMYFTGGMALHGVPDNEVADANLSHGCVRMHVADAEWLRYNFANIGTKVVVKPY